MEKSEFLSLDPNVHFKVVQSPPIISKKSHHKHKRSSISSASSTGSAEGQVSTKNIGVGVNLMVSKNSSHSVGGSCSSGMAGVLNLRVPHVNVNGTLTPSKQQQPSPSASSRASPLTSLGGLLPSVEMTRSSSSSPQRSQNPTYNQIKQESDGNQRTLNPNDPQQPQGAPRIVSQNLNGTLAVTRLPTNDSELQLYRVLQRANLVSYFDVMIELGGDDLQQLCEAGEEEFLEIMSLIGMASKPLHVRRFQKALQEWMTSTTQAQAAAITPSLAPTSIPDPLPILSSNNSNSHSPIPQVQRPMPLPYPTSTNPHHHPSFSAVISSTLATSGHPTSGTTQPVSAFVSSGQLHDLKQQQGVEGRGRSSSNSPSSLCSGGSSGGGKSTLSDHQLIPSHFLETRIRTASEENSPASQCPSIPSADSPQLDSRTSLSPIPFLQEQEVMKLAEMAIKIVETLPHSLYEPRITNKKKLANDYETVIRISETDPNRLDEIRKYAAIYGRYDCKRKLQKPLTIHELSVNEGAAQLCRHIPALLTRRDELFPLARQVVRDAGLPYMGLTNYTNHSSNSSNPNSPQNNYTNQLNKKATNGFTNGILNNNNSSINFNNTTTSNGHFYPTLNGNGMTKKLKLLDGRGVEITVRHFQEYTRSNSFDYENSADDFHKKFYPNEFPIISPIDMKKEKHGGYSIVTSQSLKNSEEPDDLSISANISSNKY